MRLESPSIPSITVVISASFVEDMHNGLFEAETCDLGGKCILRAGRSSRFQGDLERSGCGSMRNSQRRLGVS